jgi:hypothetical protein
MDTHALAGGTGFLYRNDVESYPPSKIRRGVDRLVLNLRADEGVQIGHFLIRAGDPGRAFMSGMTTRSERAMAWTCTTWDPWSIVITETSVARTPQPFGLL